mgnify:CR=1 FL=1
MESTFGRTIPSVPWTGQKIEPYAIGAIIDLGNCLDLTESVSLRIVKESYKYLAFMNEISETPMPVNESGFTGDDDLIKRYLDCAVIHNVHALREEEELEPFSTVRAPFTEGKELFTGSKIQSKTHIQICVREPARIRGIFRIKEQLV